MIRVMDSNSRLFGCAIIVNVLSAITRKLSPESLIGITSILMWSQKRLMWDFLIYYCYKILFQSLQLVGDALKITWNDGHKSSFDLVWLAERNFSKDNISNYLENCYQPKKLIWGREEFEVIFQSFDYNKVLSDDSELLRWLEALAIRGIALLKNTPRNAREIFKLADRVAFIRRTHFGDYLDLKAKKETSTWSYTPSALQLHSDFTYCSKTSLRSFICSLEDLHFAPPQQATCPAWCFFTISSSRIPMVALTWSQMRFMSLKRWEESFRYILKRWHV